MSSHVGYSLDRDSVPLCQGVEGDRLQGCFMKKRKTFIWENRDFVVDSEAVLSYFQSFVMFGHVMKWRLPWTRDLFCTTYGVSIRDNQIPITFNKTRRRQCCTATIDHKLR